MSCTMEAWVATEENNAAARALYTSVAGKEVPARAVVYTWPLLKPANGTNTGVLPTLRCTRTAATAGFARFRERVNSNVWAGRKSESAGITNGS